jgi:hypothetical protein
MCVSDCRGYAPSLVTFAEAPGGGGGEDLRHALLDGTVADDIDNVTNLVLAKVGGQSDHALLLEIAREGCVVESAFGVHNSLARRNNSQCHSPSRAPSSHDHVYPPSFFPAARCKTNHSECPS